MKEKADLVFAVLCCGINREREEYERDNRFFGDYERGKDRDPREMERDSREVAMRDNSLSADRDSGSQPGSFF